MRALLQRSKQGSVTIDGQRCANIGTGMVILLGVGRHDTEQDALQLARKTVGLRIFSDENGKMNLSLRDIGGEALVVSQFTLYADTSRGNRPGFEPASAPALAKRLYECYVAALKEQGVSVCTGEFGADMQVELINDGPVTIMLESQAQKEEKN